MPSAGLSRRDLIKTAALTTAGAYPLLSSAVGMAQASRANDDNLCGALDEKQFPPPPAEVATLYSKEYGQRRITRIQAALQQANLDALIVSNRGLDYIGYVSNFHPYPLEPGLALVLADGPSTLFVSTYSSAHSRALKPTLWVDEMVDVPHDPVSEGSNQNLVDGCIQRLKDRKLERGRIGIAGDEIDWLLPYYFREKLPDGKLQDASRTLTQLIVVKDDVELALIRFAQSLIDEVALSDFPARLHPDR